MPPRRRPTFTLESVDQQLQQIHLLDPSSPSENLEQLGPIIQQIHAARHQDAYLRILKSLIESKESEIEEICGQNYEDFVASVSTLLTVRQYTHNLQDKITTLDGSVSSVGKALLTKKKELLELKATSANLDAAIDALQACLRVLDVVQRVGDMIGEGKYWSALRSLEEVQNLPPSSLSQTPFFAHLLSSVPSLRAQIKDAVTAATKSWLLEIRNISGKVGKLALEAMESRSRRWKLRQEKDPMLRNNGIGSAVELASNEGKEVDVLDNEKLRVDFKPLYQCIQIYTALDSLDQLQRSYHADRKAQSTLILPATIALSALPDLTQELAGFFIVETHVICTTRNFRSDREVEELWEEAIRRVSEGIRYTLRTEQDPEMFVAVKECLVGFSQTMEVYEYPTQSLHSAILSFLDSYVPLLQKQSGKIFEDVINADELLPMRFNDISEREAAMKAVWISSRDAAEIAKQPAGQVVPWSPAFYLCCKEIRNFALRLYRFVEGIMQHYRDVDDILGKTLDATLTKHIGETLAKRVSATSVLSQIAQIMINVDYFSRACKELEVSLPALRVRSKGDTISLPSFPASLARTLSSSMDRITSIIRSKLNDFFELSEYDWTPQNVSLDGPEPSMYLYELVNWLTTVVDSLMLRGSPAEDGVYKGAIGYVSDCLLDFVTDQSVASISEQGLANLLVDVNFLEDQLRQSGRGHLVALFSELRTTVSLPLQNKIPDYLIPSIRVSTYANVRPKRLGAVLEKLARYSVDRGKRGDLSEREKGEKRRREAESVGRIYPGEGR